ncbi:hypothetical protein SAMN05444340_103278 [Citreimonas salinaria]|uniref:PilZ domain-containing protein n=2 Tax=Citreimonas salinaria TaxID=321339 RepID=A0A1H3H980_9RHOB|nr:hypothetical protein SAMN05444340_103278 [Citreimonas salinaria]
MGFEKRANRWPSSWQMIISFGGRAESVVEVRNVSASGMKCAGRAEARPGERVQFGIMGQKVTGYVVRQGADDFAISFLRPLTDAQLHCLRQFRRLPVSEKQF